MHLTPDHPLAEKLVVLQPEGRPSNLQPIGRLAAADNIENWVDQHQADGTIKRIEAPTHFMLDGAYLRP